ncbi:sialate O-acetylesterase [Sphingobacterium sp. xlx-130]|uniref:sialate O-acetylesterase n=1 Tax=Sphingobacterium sp. xlx-130 TaxID=2654323 RepID=UPI0013DC661A|nr:sialate O-acetylesterase [Sphingobacterium sp. xlx-130]
MIKNYTPNRLIVWAIILLISPFFSGTAVGQVWNPDQRETHVFLLMGQSNMAGYGDMLPEDSVAVRGVFYIPTIGNEPFQWKVASHPLHNRLKSDRFGLGIPFAKEYQKKHPNVIVGLIPVAWGGAGIDRLSKGTSVYADAIKKALFAAGQGAKIKGVLWHQGESDTVSEELATSYEQKLRKMISDLRNDLGVVDLPFVVGNLAEFYGTGPDHNAPQRVLQINTVKQTLRNLPQKVKHTGFVESVGCKSIDHHNVHFDRESYIILGKRYADKLEEM